MKIRKVLSHDTLIIVSLSNLFLLSSIHMADAIRSGRRGRGTCGTRNPNPISRHSMRSNGNGKVDALWNYSPYHQHQYNTLLRHNHNLYDQLTDMIRGPASWTFDTLFEGELPRQISEDTTWHPPYDIIETSDKMELTLELPGIKPEDISLELQNDGKSIMVSAKRQIKYDGAQEAYEGIVTKSFEQVFNIDDTVIDVEQISADLSNGVLVITGPKKVSSRKEPRKIQVKSRNDRNRMSLRSSGMQKMDEDVLLDSLNSDDGSGKERKNDDLEISEEEDL